MSFRSASARSSLRRRGLTNREIADQYFISIHTVISHRKNITRKTGIKTIAGLTVYALLNNMISEADLGN